MGYDLFELEQDVPTDAYELEEAVKDGFLVPPRVAQVDMRFPRQGIDYEELSKEEQAQWEGLDWGDDRGGDGRSAEDPDRFPDKVNAGAINSWLFNQDTVDKVLQHLMEHGHRVEGGDQLAKTIIFARNHQHAAFIEQRFNAHYPKYAGQFARVIDNTIKHAQDLIDEFELQDQAPHIAISVDMLDTGIDVPAVANLVFFKPVFSKIKFWQMIGRGTRLCPELFGPEADKEDFRVFDFCFNFDFFQENPEGINAVDTPPLSTRLFRARVQLLGHLQNHPEINPNRGTSLAPSLAGSLADGLHLEITALERNNFIVRRHLQAVERFQERPAWDQLSESDQMVLQRDLANLPTLPQDDIKSRLFDLTALRMQLALVEGGSLERSRQRIMEIALLLEADKSTVPAVKAQRAYLSALQENEFWQDINLTELEELRLRLRELVPLLDRQERKRLYTDFQDEVLGVREVEPVYIPRMTGAQYEKKVKEYLRNHTNHLVIQRLKSNEPLTVLDLQGLETTLVEIGEEEGKDLLSGLLERKNASSLAHFIRSLVGLDRGTAKAAFADFLNDHGLSAPQIRFIELIIDQLTARGVMESGALYQSPFSNLHAGGPEALFAGKKNVIEAVFETLESLEPQIQEVGSG